jgi:DNA polymerase elongation subunit (family B)
MKFFKNFDSRGDTLFVVEHDNGQDFYREFRIKPSLYSLGNGDYKTIHGQSLSRVDFDSPKSAKDFAGMLGDKTYGFDRFAYSEIHKRYGNDYDLSKIRGVIIDIENAVDDKFPDIETADTPINCLTMFFRGTYFCYTTLPIDGLIAEPDEKIWQFNSESEMLTKFLMHFKQIRPDWVSGWNSSGYDLPYIVTRIRVVLGTEAMNSLSPFGKVRVIKNENEGKISFEANIMGVSDLDFMVLYKKFRLITRESYKLGFIGSVELDETKNELPGSFKDTYTNYPKEFVKYNIQDTKLVVKLEAKLSMIDLAMSIAYVSKTNYQDCLENVRVWDVLIANYLIDQNIVVPYRRNTNAANESYEGAYVKEPIRGYYDWAISFDFESLYPRLIQTYNISPETMITKDAWIKLRPTDIVQKTDLYKSAKKNADRLDATLCGNGGLFRRDKVGFIPVLAEMMFNRRKDAKKPMLKYKTQLELIEAEINRRGLGNTN